MEPRTTRLNPLDTAWLFTESRATPNHVGGLLTFRLPPGAPQDYLRQMMVEFREHRTFVAPWNRQLKSPFTKNPMPLWVETEDIDLEYHVRHAALPWPGGERELGELVGRLHSTPIDLTRPPWECTIIEGLTDGRFALFIKIHHALIDGVSGVRLLFRAFAERADDSLELPPFWAAQAPASAGSAKGSGPSSGKRVGGKDVGLGAFGGGRDGCGRGNTGSAGAVAASVGGGLRPHHQAHRRPE